MKILVTGAAGFIGANFVRWVSSVRDWQITVLDSLTYAGNLDNIIDLLEAKKLNFVKADIADEKTITDLFQKEKYDLVFNFAAESHVDRSILSASEFVRTNVSGTQALLNASMSSGVKRFIQVSTDEVYGSLGATGVFYETTPLDPTSPYAASKAAGDLMVQAASKTHGYDAVITRCTNNYGPYQFPEKFIPLFISNAVDGKRLPLYGDGMNIRSWIYVVDHCEAVLAVAERGRSGEVYNIGSTSEGEIPNRVVAECILKSLGKSTDLIQYVADRPAHDRRYAVSIDKIKLELDWKPKVSFEAGIAKTIEWYLNNRAWWEKIKSGEYLKYYEKQYSQRLAGA